MYQRQVQAFNGNVSEVASSTSTVTLTEQDPNRLGLTIFNKSTAVLSVKLGAGAAANDFTVEVAGGGYYEVPFGFVGEVTGFWASVDGNAYVTALR